MCTIINSYLIFNWVFNIQISMNYFQYFMENKKEITLEDFVLNGWIRLKQLMLVENMDVKDTELPVDVDNDRQVEETEDQDENEDDSDHVEDDVKYTESEDFDESQYDEETKLIIEGK